MAKGDYMQERLVRLAVSMVHICDRLPETKSGGHIASQLLRSGTSPAPNYAEARGAESDRDFVHKLRVVLKELNETEVWLQIIVRTGIVSPDAIRATREECTSLARIIGASIRTMKERGVASSG
jgi:four helix bundle protein